MNTPYMNFQYFNNEKYEADRYDEALKKYQDASLKTSTSLAMLNFGQNAIFSAALSGIMILAANEILQGDLVHFDINNNIKNTVYFRQFNCRWFSDGKWSSFPTIHPVRISGQRLQRSKTSADRYANYVYPNGNGHPNKGILFAYFLLILTV